MVILHIVIIAVLMFTAGFVWGAGAIILLRKRRREQSPFSQGGFRGISTRATQVGGDHYRSKKIQPWDAMEAWMSHEQFKGFLRGNAIKYLARCDDKGGMEDVKKAGHYIAKMMEPRE